MSTELKPAGFKRLTFDGVNDLYLTPYGAHTLADYEEIKALRSAPRPAQQLPRIIPTSLALEMRNEACIDECGCGSF